MEGERRADGGISVSGAVQALGFEERHFGIDAAYRQRCDAMTLPETF